MTLAATAVDGKSSAGVMARAAGHSFFHLGHGNTFVALAGNEQFGMAIIATVESQMKLVAEQRTRFLELDLLHRVTFVAGILDGEGGFGVMTTAT